MSFERIADGHIEVSYTSAEDMAPEQQRALIDAIERELSARRLTVLFRVGSISVPPAVPTFWLNVTKKHAPKLRAMAVVSDSVAVRAAATSFGIANILRGVSVAVRPFKNSEVEIARQWCQSSNA
ncbi:MAG: STAS/SEC14 domain-containing protein [Deltaproteobacteria bacterium]|nr:STAS/SEC14 domain-containing protein [Deltaproteobacteria bacterium]